MDGHHHLHFLPQNSTTKPVSVYFLFAVQQKRKKIINL